MQDRLKACGLRPINNIVDISNYVMLEYGQPLHTFDFDRLEGGRIIVRRARQNEVLTTLDGVERKLNSEMLVIADATRAVAVAGVMGGANSEVSPQTHNILLEAASFKATSIHSTGETLGLPSEARYRFERGLAPGLTLSALKRATQLLIELGGGQAAPGCIDVYPGRRPEQPVCLSLHRLHRLIGMAFTRDEVLTTLQSLGMDCRAVSDDLIEAFSPYWRSDINIEVDLIEEVARIRGYEQIPTTLLAEPLPQINTDPIVKLKDNIRSGLCSTGFSEILSFSLTGMDILRKISTDNQPPAAEALRVANPMTADSEYLRTSLRGNLLKAFNDNRKYQAGSIRIFELGKIYLGRGDQLPDERETVCAAIGGQRYEKSWQNQDEIIDFFDAKGILEGLLLKQGLQAVFEKSQDPGLHPNKQAACLINQKKVGVLGELHPKVALAFEINEPVFIVELDLPALVSFTSVDRVYHPVAKFPSIARDMALIEGVEATHQQIKKIIESYSLVELVEIFDVYSGGQVPAGQKSLAYRISYRSPSHTLTDEEVSRVQQQILEKLNKELGAVLRSQ